MPGRLNVLTGATGLLGSHVAELLAARGERVRALVRPTSDTHFLQGLGVEIVTGDLADQASVERAFAGADVVYHCASRVGDWAPWRSFQRDVIDATRDVLAVCETANVGRLLYVSSIMAYGRPAYRGQMFTEEEPLGQNLRRWEYYARAKVAAERLCQSYRGELTILRPSWIYGPRDRNGLPRLLKGVRAGRVALIGTGDKPVNLVFAGDVARAAILAAGVQTASGQAYNVSGPGDITHQELLGLLTDALGLPPVRRGVSFRTAYLGGWLGEVIGTAIFLQRPPYVTRYGVALIERSTMYSNEKAKRELGWEARTPAKEGIRLALAWQKQWGALAS